MQKSAGNQKYFILRGIPGSGKSTTAKILQQGLNGQFYEADQYFMVDGEYKFDRNKLGSAHQWCQTAVAAELAAGWDCIVSNTFTTIKELRPYFKIGAKLGIKPSVLTCHGNYGSIHGVPDDALKAMRDRFVYNLDDLYAEYFS